jgi:hypothetical protein
MHHLIRRLIILNGRTKLESAKGKESILKVKCIGESIFSPLSVLEVGTKDK